MPNKAKIKVFILLLRYSNGDKIEMTMNVVNKKTNKIG